MSNKKVLVTGVTGQDGRFLAEHLHNLDYEVWGLVRRCSNAEGINGIKKICPNAKLRYGDLTDPASLHRIINECKPEFVYNLGAQSHVRISFDMPEYTCLVNGNGVVYLLDVVKDVVPDAKVYHASTSELFGSSEPPQNENTPFHPRSPYGFSKLEAYWAVINYRESYDMFVSQGILFNHESELRGENFVTRKISKAVARIALGMQDCLYLGNLDAKRDWGYAKDYIKAMHKILQQDVPDEFVIATGEAHSVRDFLERAFDFVDIKITTNGKSGLEESYINIENGKEVVKIDPRFYRPAEVNYLLGDASKANKILGWKPEVNFEQLVELMIRYDYDKEHSKTW